MLILGPPAAGKGTQAEMISRQFGVPNVSPGAILRRLAGSGSALGLEAAKLTGSGKLAPDSVVNALIGEWLSSSDGRFVMDGYPRTLDQGHVFAELLEERSWELESVFWIDLDEGEIRDRVGRRIVCFACGEVGSSHGQETVAKCRRCGGTFSKRADDSDQALAERMSQYHELTLPLKCFYADAGLLRVIDGNRPKEEVFADIAAAIHGP